MAMAERLRLAPTASDSGLQRTPNWARTGTCSSLAMVVGLG